MFSPVFFPNLRPLHQNFMLLVCLSVSFILSAHSFNRSYFVSSMYSSCYHKLCTTTTSNLNETGLNTFIIFLTTQEFYQNDVYSTLPSPILTSLHELSKIKNQDIDVRNKLINSTGGDCNIKEPSLVLLQLVRSLSPGY